MIRPWIQTFFKHLTPIKKFEAKQTSVVRNHSPIFLLFGKKSSWEPATFRQKFEKVGLTFSSSEESKKNVIGEM